MVPRGGAQALPRRHGGLRRLFGGRLGRDVAGQRRAGRVLEVLSGGDAARHVGQPAHVRQVPDHRLGRPHGGRRRDGAAALHDGRQGRDRLLRPAGQEAQPVGPAQEHEELGRRQAQARPPRRAAERPRGHVRHVIRVFSLPRR